MKDKHTKISFNVSETLTKFLELNEQEQTLKNIFEIKINIYIEPKKILDKRKDQHLNTIIQTIFNTDMITIIKIAENSPIFSNFLEHEKLQDLWQECWRLMGENPTHDMLPQSKINCRLLLFGYFYYQKALDVREIEGKKCTITELEFLKKAESYHSFHAINALNKHDLMCLKQCIQAYQHIDAIIKRAQVAAYFHGTPGYLMLAESCYCIAMHHKVFDNKSGIIGSLIQAIRYLKQADVILEDSYAAINNAYFGAGIAASNELGLGEISAIKDLIIKNAGEYLRNGDIAYAEQLSNILPRQNISF